MQGLREQLPPYQSEDSNPIQYQPTERKKRKEKEQKKMNRAA